MPIFEGELRAHPDARFAIVASRWNSKITETLIEGARSALTGNGVSEAMIDVIRVPGAWELPVVCATLAKAGAHSGIVALGCVIRGDTRHYEQVADGASNGLMQVQIDTGVPVANGVLAVEQFEDAEARAGGSHGNKGEEAAFVVLEMANLLERFQ
ncbi:6,7-dimethyl-8-ribityllumazine synthase [Lysobacter soyae]|uniref:6,7-dimethyl-8-ribityllumazine synthase n=1 Tax=Lysobacter soyae TaxID=2764185 RepID=A0ABX8WM25_9GAMM|nr:6,7-dimethyl-8-ribityllumazine synthase [Lysobacter sp. CJ11]QYR52690.1 6,7-dimethyl-8-ribityllumazine synthase [Lysobacter sp. CJ11]